MLVNRQKSANFISILGHPLLFGNAYVVFMSFENLDTKTAFLVSSLVFFLIAIPIIWNNLKKMRSGEYSNFDVSDRQQRMAFYPFAISLFVVLLLSFWVLGFPDEVLRQTLIFFVMILNMALFNLKIKASMHAGIAFYIGVNIFGLGFLAGTITTVFAFAVAWSRWEMKRHDFKELLIGALIGVLFGGIGLLI